MDSSFNQRNEPLLHDILTIKNEFINNKNTHKSFFDNNQKEIIETLVIMGFNLEMIDMCFCFFTINSIEQAVQMMSRENGVWQHDYIKSESNVCIICNEYSDHNNFIIDKEKKLEKLKELNESFISKFRSSIEHLRESNANRVSNNSNNSDLIRISENINTNVFEININFSEKEHNEIANEPKKIRVSDTVEIGIGNNYRLINKNNFGANLKTLNTNSNESYLFEEPESIDDKVYMKPLNEERRKLKKFDLRDKINVLDVGELQEEVINESKDEYVDIIDLLTEENFEGKECNVCLMTIDKGNIILSCKHLFCNDCWIAYIKDKIDCNEIRKISCMEKDCKKDLLQANIEKIISFISDAAIRQNYLNKLQKFKTENEVIDDKNLKLCPIPDCGGHASLKNKKPGNVLTCNNSHDFCLKCLNPAHPKKNCEAVLDEFFKKWRTGKIIKKCPNCKFWTEKNEGCNHMTCRGCQYQWCWLCSAKYSQIHYKIGFCSGLQFSNDRNIHSSCWRYKNFLKKGFFKQIIRIYLQFIILLFIGSYFVAFKKFERWRIDYHFNRKAKCLLFLSLMITALAFQPLYSVLSFAYVALGIFLSLFMPCWSSRFVEFVEIQLLRSD